MKTRPFIPPVEKQALLTLPISCEKCGFEAPAPPPSVLENARFFADYKDGNITFRLARMQPAEIAELLSLNARGTPEDAFSRAPHKKHVEDWWERAILNGPLPALYLSASGAKKDVLVNEDDVEFFGAPEAYENQLVNIRSRVRQYQVPLRAHFADAFRARAKECGGCGAHAHTWLATAVDSWREEYELGKQRQARYGETFVRFHYGTLAEFLGTRFGYPEVADAVQSSLVALHGGAPRTNDALAGLLPFSEEEPLVTLHNEICHAVRGIVDTCGYEEVVSPEGKKALVRRFAETAEKFASLEFVPLFDRLRHLETASSQLAYIGDNEHALKMNFLMQGCITNLPGYERDPNKMEFIRHAYVQRCKIFLVTGKFDKADACVREIVSFKTDTEGDWVMFERRRRDDIEFLAHATKDTFGAAGPVDEATRKRILGLWDPFNYWFGKQDRQLRAREAKGE